MMWVEALLKPIQSERCWLGIFSSVEGENDGLIGL
jgi:hypothetical protein